jgi:hypothetical protein
MDPIMDAALASCPDKDSSANVTRGKLRVVVRTKHSSRDLCVVPVGPNAQES